MTPKGVIAATIKIEFTALAWGDTLFNDLKKKEKKRKAPSPLNQKLIKCTPMANSKCF